MYIGIDLGTSAVKAVLVDAEQRVLGQSSAPLEVSRPRPLWSEQDPEHWWRGASAAVASLRAQLPREFAAVLGVGLSGQMHGATLLDARDRVLRPAILWNDGRSAAACAELERRAPEIRAITGNRVMPGFTAPKLVWLAEHEPDVFAEVASVLLPKDWLRLRLSGDRATDVSDASGTSWLDVGRRVWSEALVEATGLPAGVLPSLYEGSQATGRMRPALAREWGLSGEVVIAAGAGDQAAGAAGAGVVDPGEALLALGTSGVLFVAGDRFAPNPDGAVHAFCHCLPGRWHQMSVMLSAAACLAWLTQLVGADEATLLAEAEAADRDVGRLLFLPYLSGERTPHDDPHARGVFFGLEQGTQRADLTRAVLEGVAFGLADGQAALQQAATRIGRVWLIGGGARSGFWARILASALDRPLEIPEEAEVGPAFGAARLARLAVTGEEPRRVCIPLETRSVVEPDPLLPDRYAARYAAFRELYTSLRERFRD